MKINVLVDNNTYIDVYYLGEPAVSYYVEDGDTKILFDTGYSDAFLRNAEGMGINLERVDKLVLSHGHIDHTNGLRYYMTKKRDIDILGCPTVFDPREFDNGEAIGSPLGEEEMRQLGRVSLSAKPCKVSEHTTFLGEIPTLFDFEKRYRIGKIVKYGRETDDYLFDDSAMVYQSDEGLFIITGCSHSGICSIIEYAKEVCRDDRVIGVLGGFHLFEEDERTRKTIEYLKANRIGLLYPCHCVSLPVKAEMAKELDIREVGVGLEITL